MLQQQIQISYIKKMLIIGILSHRIGYLYVQFLLHTFSLAATTLHFAFFFFFSANIKF